VTLSALTGEGVGDLREALLRLAPADHFDSRRIVADLVPPGEVSGLPASLTRGGLTRMLYRGFTKVYGYTGVESLWSLARHVLSRDIQADGAQRRLYCLYWGGIDAAIHAHGAAVPPFEGPTQLKAPIVKIAPIAQSSGFGTLK
jgi:hypothetical protein